MKNENNGFRSVHVEFTNFSEEEVEVINKHILIALKNAKFELDGGNENE